MQKIDEGLFDNRKAVAFIATGDWIDLALAAILAVVTFAILSLFPFPALHPDFWGSAAVAIGTRPPESPVTGTWTLFAHALCVIFGQQTGFGILVILGRLVGAFLVGIAYLLLRSLLSDRVNLPAPELSRCNVQLRFCVAVSVLLFVCSESAWRQMQFFSYNLLHLSMAAMALCAYGLFRRHGRLSWYCLSYFLSGCMAAETPLGVLFALMFMIGNVVSKKWGSRKLALAVSINEGKIDDPVDFMDEEIASEVERAETSLENWVFSVFFFFGFFAFIFIDSWAFRAMGGMTVKNIGNWDYPVVLFAAWIGQLRNVITLDDFLAVSTFSMIPFLISYALMPLATDPKGRLAFPLGWLIVFMGIGAWTQLSPFAKFWYWAWDIERSSAPSGAFQTVLAFFGAGALSIAFQIACCACRKRQQGIDTISVVETRGHSFLRLFGRVLLAVVALTMLIGSVLGRRQPVVRARLAFLWEYARLVVEHVQGVRWVFTDGSFDDALALVFREKGESGWQPVSVLAGHKPYETFLRIRTAVDDEDRPMLEASGSEALRFWVSEKPAHLRESAVQIGFNTLKKCKTDHPVPAGLAMRVVTSPEDAARFARANEETIRFSDFAKELAEARLGTIGGYDRAVFDKFDFLLWRLARMADQRAAACARADDRKGIATHHDQAVELDQVNGSFRKLVGKLERLKPAEGVVLTPREGLDVALKRADFELARQYAYMVMRVDKTDPNANFALGMWSLEANEYRRAVEFLEIAARKCPEQSPILNNLALAYVRLGELEMAKEVIERAKKIDPKAPSILRNEQEIERQIKERKAAKESKKD